MLVYFVKPKNESPTHSGPDSMLRISTPQTVWYGVLIEYHHWRGVSSHWNITGALLHKIGAVGLEAEKGTKNLHYWSPFLQDQTCTFCNLKPETIEHLYFQWIYIKDIWWYMCLRKRQSLQVFNQSINHGFHINQGLWRPWTATDRDLVPFEPQ